VKIFASHGTPPVSTTPAANLPPIPLVSLIPVANLPPVANNGNTIRLLAPKSELEEKIICSKCWLDYSKVLKKIKKMSE
jgi:hypothetical protein